MTSKTTQFFKGISTQTIITLVMGVMEVVVFAIISRLLSKTDFGYYAAISGIIAIFMSISEAGLGSTYIYLKKKWIWCAIQLRMAVSKDASGDLSYMVNHITMNA